MTPLLRAMKSVLGPAPAARVPRLVPLPARRRVRDDDGARAHRSASRATGASRSGMLAEVYRNCSLKRICQVELVDNYDHKHRELSEDDATPRPAPHGGRHRLVADPQPRELRRRVRRRLPEHADRRPTCGMAQDAVAALQRRRRAERPRFDRHEEELAVETFSRALRTAGLGFVRDPMGAPQIPNWNRVTSALPDFLHDAAGGRGGGQPLARAPARPRPRRVAIYGAGGEDADRRHPPRGRRPLVLIAGLNVIESEAATLEAAARSRELAARHGFPLVFKASRGQGEPLEPALLPRPGLRRGPARCSRA